MSIIDISRKLNPTTAVWPGDTNFQIEQVMQLADGDSVNLTKLTLSAHTGTHADAFLHFKEDATDIASMPLLPYWGKAQLVEFDMPPGELKVHHFEDISLQAPRLLVKSHLSKRDEEKFHHDILYPGPELAEWMKSMGIILFGTDASSVDAVDSKDLPGHHALGNHGIAILENLSLGKVSPGLYELVALPLKISGGDGSPVRAALKPL